jgi:hypothetical protein
MALKDWDTPTDPQGEEGIKRTVRNSTFTIKTVTTRITFITTTNLSRKIIIKSINELIKTAFGPNKASIYPLDRAGDQTPIEVLKKETPDKYSTHTASSSNHRTTAILRIGIPATVTYPQWKRATDGLIPLLTTKAMYWEEAHLESISIWAPLFLYGVPTTGIDIKTLQQMLIDQCDIQNPIT